MYWSSRHFFIIAIGLRSIGAYDNMENPEAQSSFLSGTIIILVFLKCVWICRLGRYAIRLLSALYFVLKVRWKWGQMKKVKRENRDCMELKFTRWSTTQKFSLVGFTSAWQFWRRAILGRRRTTLSTRTSSGLFIKHKQIQHGQNMEGTMFLESITSETFIMTVQVLGKQMEARWDWAGRTYCLASLHKIRPSRY